MRMGSPSRFEAVLFDFGGVVIASPFAAFAELARAGGGSPHAVREINSQNPDGNAWARAERGELDADGFAQAFTAEARALGHQLDGAEVLAALRSLGPSRETAVPAMLAAIDRCRELELRVGLITNNIRTLHAEPEAAWVFDTFDTVVESCVEGVRKPEPAIYEVALGRLGVGATGTIMLDDLGINLKPARALGITTIKVTDPDAAAAELLTLVDPIRER